VEDIIELDRPVRDLQEVKPSINLMKALSPAIKRPTFTYRLPANSNTRKSGEAWYPAEYDFVDIGMAEDTDSFVYQANFKKLALAIKAGWAFVSRDQTSLDYIKRRISEIEIAQGQSFWALQVEVLSNLLRYHNCFLIKARDISTSSGKVRNVDGFKLKPIAGYFVASPETMLFQIGKDYHIKGYKHIMPDGREKVFAPEDVVHFHIYRKTHHLAGTPSWVPVLDDITALRRIEENIENLVHQHIHPLFQYKVGTEQAPMKRYEDGLTECDVVRAKIQDMANDGMIITPERHEIKGLGSESRALRAETYLEYFKKRVISGAGLSELDFGYGDCYDALTETLTETGWKRHWEIDHTVEKIATFNPETSKIEFHLPNYKYEAQYVGDMIQFRGKHIDIKVTPNHKMWARARNVGSQWQKVEAHELYHGKWSEFYLLESAEFDSQDINERFTIKAEKQKRGPAPTAVDCDLESFAKVLGYFVSEGCLDKGRARNGAYRINISQNRGESFDRIVEAISDCGLSFSTYFHHSRPDEGHITIYGKTLYHWLEQHIAHGARNKNLPQMVLGWPKLARNALLEALIDGDGTVDKNEGATNRTYYTTSSQLANDVQVLALSLGLKAKVKLTRQSSEAYGESIYRVHISGRAGEENSRIVTMDMISKVACDEPIYCYNVPNHLFLTRRNGKVTVQGNTSNRACYSEDTETLTENGWKHYSEILPGEKIATFNPANNQLEYHEPDGGIFLYDYEGPMYHFKNRNVDTLVTPDHDMWVEHRLWKRSEWTKVHAEDIKFERFGFRTGGIEWAGVDPGDFLLPHVPYGPNVKCPNQGPFERIDISDWLEFLGYYVSEGYLAKARNKWAVTISQNSVVNAAKTEKIRRCLTRLPFKFNEYTDSNDHTTRFWIHCKSLYLYLQENCKDHSYLKQFPEEILSYSEEYLRIAFEAAMAGDGTSDGREGGSSRTYYSTSDNLIDQMQEIAIKLGYRAHVLPGAKCSRVCISIGAESEVNQSQVEVVDYRGKVYCFRVPNHLFFTRRNGRIGIHGNTADTMSKLAIDNVKFYQQCMADVINFQVVRELMLESTFPYDHSDDEQRVELQFNEIDLESQIKMENHFMLMYQGNTITETEARRHMGREPLRDDKREDTFLHRIDKPRVEWQVEADLNKAKAQAANKQQPTNQHGKKSGPTKRKSSVERDGVATEAYNELAEDIRRARGRTVNLGFINQLFLATAERTKSLFQSSIESAVFRGSRSYPPSFALRLELEAINKRIRRDFENDVDRLFRDAAIETQAQLIEKKADRLAIDVLEYRMRFIEHTLLHKAYILGKVAAMRSSGVQRARIKSDPEGEDYQIWHNIVIDLNDISLENLPPYHPNCECDLEPEPLNV